MTDPLTGPEREDMTTGGYVPPEENRGDEGKDEKGPLFQRVFMFFLVYPELLVILVLVVLALFGITTSG